MDKPPIDAAGLAEIEAKHSETSDDYCRHCDYKGGWVKWPCLPARLAASLRQAWAEIERLKRRPRSGGHANDGQCHTEG